MARDIMSLHIDNTLHSSAGLNSLIYTVLNTVHRCDGNVAVGMDTCLGGGDACVKHGGAENVKISAWLEAKPGADYSR
jgi:hypothetical protein